MNLACQAMWVIKHALEKIDATVTVYGFNTESFLIYSKDERADQGKARMIGAS
jgi:hypothetical protein